MNKRTVPKHLSMSTRKWVKVVLNEFELQDHHFHLLILAGEALDRSELARREIAKHGMTFSGKDGSPRLRPEVLVERDSKDLFRRLLRELNLSEESAESRPPRLKYGGE